MKNCTSPGEYCFSLGASQFFLEIAFNKRSYLNKFMNYQSNKQGY